MGGLRLTLCLLVLVTYAIPFSSGIPETCLTVYKQGGVSAVLQSPTCSLWIESTTQSVQKRTTNCHFISSNGFHDRLVLCNVDMTIPLPGKYGTEEISAKVAAVFDSYAGVEASEIASNFLSDYFLLHSVFTSISENLVSAEGYNMMKEEPNEDARREQHDVHLLSYGKLPVVSEKLCRKRIFEESLVRSVNEIDSTFSKEAFGKNLTSGAVGTVVVRVDDHFLVANVGDLEGALCSENDALCSENLCFHKEVKETGNVPYLCAEELSKDHIRNRVDRGERFVTAGGHVFKWEISYWADVIFSVTRTIVGGFLKSVGVISEPEVTDYKPLAAHDARFLVAIDSIFSMITPEKVVLNHTRIQELVSFLNQRMQEGFLEFE